MKFAKKMIFILLVCILVAGPAQFVGHAQDPVPGTPVPLGGEGTFSTNLPLVHKVGPVTPAYPTNPVFGIEMGSELANPNKTGPVDLMATAGASWVRYNGLIWSNVEPSPGARNWTWDYDPNHPQDNIDYRMQNASKYKLTPILVIRSTPSWAQKYAGYSCGPMSQSTIDEFAKFVKDAVARYSAAPYNVMYYEIWNEPDLDRVAGKENYPYGCWGEPTDTQYYGGGYYAEVLKQVYPAVKQANSNAQLLVGGLLVYCDPANPPTGSVDSRNGCLPSKYLNGILANGGGPYFDGVTYHSYDFFNKPANMNDSSNYRGVTNNKYWLTAWNTTGPTIIRKTNYLREVLNQYGFGGKYLIVSEIASACNPDSSGAENHCNSKYPTTSLAFQNTKAYYVVQSYAASIQLRLKAIIWYSYFGWWNSGLYGLDSNKNEPAYYSYKFAAQELSGTTAANELSLASDIKGYEFMKANKKVWLLWYVGGDQANGNLTKNVTLPSTPTAVFRWIEAGSGQTNAASYQAASIAQTLSIGRAPVFIELAP